MQHVHAPHVLETRLHVADHVVATEAVALIGGSGKGEETGREGRQTIVKQGMIARRHKRIE